MSQTDLAKTLKAEGLPFHQQTIQRIENLERPVRLDEAFLIAGVFNTTVDSMIDQAVPSRQEVIWAMNRVAKAATEAAETLLETYWEWVDGLQTFADTTSDLLAQATRKFDELPNAAQVALALCKVSLELSESISKLFRRILSKFGDDKGETREDAWDYALPDETPLLYMRDLLDKYQCAELDSLAESTWPYLRYSLERNKDK